MNATPPPPAAGGSGAADRLRVYGPALWAAVVALAALYFILLTNDIHYSGRAGRLGPAFWPRMILIMMLLVALLDCVVELRNARRRAAALTATGRAGAPPRVWWLMALGLALTLAYVNLATVLGFPTANALFMILFMLLGGFARPITAMIVSTVGTVVMVFLFVRVVYVSLPLGMGIFESITLTLYGLLGIV